MTASSPSPLAAAVAEVERHRHAAGWDGHPMLFALVRASDFVRDEPQTAALLGVDGSAGDALTPIEQDALPDGALDEALARISWPAAVVGCALSQEILVVPDDQAGDVAAAAAHPERREARLVAGVLRDGSSAVVLRLREHPDDLLTGADLAPNLVAALLLTFED